jgi:hypothetical protein
MLSKEMKWNKPSDYFSATRQQILQEMTLHQTSYVFNGTGNSVTVGGDLNVGNVEVLHADPTFTRMLCALSTAMEILCMLVAM